MKKLILTAALVAAVASPALAATSHHLRNSASVQRAYTAEDTYAYARPDADTVVADGKVIGRDPDVFIRESLTREGDHNNQNGY